MPTSCLRKLKIYKGDMLLHGIFDESKMPAAIEVIKKAINKFI